jgi:endonuclease YncB( thermonuclease family)
LFIYLLAVALLGLFSPAWAIESTGYAVDVVGVKDGDTIVVKHNKALEVIRLSGVVCPKHDQRFGPEVVKATASLCLSQTVVVESQSLDRDGRIIANVLLMDGSSLSSQLVSLGFGCCPTNDLNFQNLEANARSEHLGLWGRKDFSPPGDRPQQQNTIGKLEPPTRAN